MVSVIFTIMPSSLGSQIHASSADQEPVRFVHTVLEARRLLPSASRWNSIEIDFNLIPQSAMAYDSLPSSYSKSYDHNIVITNRKLFKRCLYISASIVILSLALILLLRFLPHKHSHHGPSKNLTLALNQALTFFDAQKCNIFLPSPLYTLLLEAITYMIVDIHFHLINSV